MRITTTRGRPPAWPWAAITAAPQQGKRVPGLQWASDALHLPFDAARWQHARTVRAGLLPRSMLESRDFERTLHALEGVTLGPFARRV